MSVCAGKYKCPQCDDSFSNSQVFRDHRINVRSAIHEPDKQKYACSKCERVFASKNGLKYHNVIEHSPSKAHACPTCKKLFPNRSSLEKHKLIHNKGRNYKQCIQSCNSLFNLSLHGTTVHVYGNTFICQICEKTVNHLSTLKKHIKHQHEDNMDIILQKGQFYSSIPSTQNISNEGISNSLDPCIKPDDSIELFENEVSASASGTVARLQTESTQQYNLYDQKLDAAQLHHYKTQETIDEEKFLSNIDPERMISIDDLPDSLIPLDITEEDYELLKDDVVATESDIDI